MEDPASPFKLFERADQSSYALNLSVVIILLPNVLPLKFVFKDICPDAGTLVPSVNVAFLNSLNDIFDEPGSEPPA